MMRRNTRTMEQITGLEQICICCLNVLHKPARHSQQIFGESCEVSLMVKHWMSRSAAVAGAAHSIRALLPPLWNRSLSLQEGGNACP